MAGRHGHSRAPLEARPAQEGLSSDQPPVEVQIFGRRDSRDTQKALRFFRERRVRVVSVDIGAKPMAPAELRRFSDKFGAVNLLDPASRAYKDAGLAYLSMTNDEAYEKALREQRLIRLPLVRTGSHLSVGLAESEWREWLRAAS